jgi:large subunit ribosomal protein L21
MKYAIIQDGGKQYMVTEGAVLDMEKKDSKPGDEIEFKTILLFGNDKDIKVGTPNIENVKVKGVVEKHFKSDKVTSMKFMRREGYKVKKGHRQNYMQVKITGIVNA